MPSRRQALALLGTFGAVGCAAFPQDDDPKGPRAEPYADRDAADEWMRKWISAAVAKDPGSSKAPNGALHVGRFADPIYYLTSVIGWDPSVLQRARYKSVRVPIGFVTDFASIPRLFWRALRPDGEYSYAAVIHDYLYWEQYLSRADADEVLKMCMEDFRIDSATIATIHAGVRIGGGFAWDANARLRAAGEKRVLRQFPADPTIRWSDWKGRPEVF